jgi:uncharacterized membrane protein YdbT with pleckstrin-like domain
MAMQNEQPVWNGSPSQVTNIGSFIFLGLFFWLIFPLFIMLWKYLTVKTTSFEISNQRIRSKSGVLSRTIDEMELYRIRDMRIVQPFFLRLFSLSSIELITTDRTNKILLIPAIKDADALLAKIRANVEITKRSSGYREVDVV